MSHRPILFFYTCPQCDHEQEVGVIAGEDAITSGPPEACDPGSPSEVDSGGECEKCGSEFDEGTLIEKAYAVARDRSEAANERDQDDRRDEAKEWGGTNQ